MSTIQVGITKGADLGRAQKEDTPPLDPTPSCMAAPLCSPPCRVLNLETQRSAESWKSGKQCRPSLAPGICFLFPQTLR